jgi:hypothetical protein
VKAGPTLPPHVLESVCELVAEQMAPRVAELIAGQIIGALPEPEPWCLLTVDEAAARLSRSPKYVRAHKHDIGYVRLDRGALGFELADVQRFARERKVRLPT